MINLSSISVCVCVREQSCVFVTCTCVGELEAEDRHHAQVQHSIGILQRDMVRLSTLIAEKQGKQDELEQHNALMEKGFVLNLKVRGDVGCSQPHHTTHTSFAFSHFVF